MPAISVKVSVKKVVAAMEAKIASNQKLIVEIEKADKKREEARKKHEAFVAANASKVAQKSGVTPTIDIRKVGWGSHEGDIKVELTYYLKPADAESLLEPEMDDPHKGISTGFLKDQNDELGNAVRLLKMTDEEYVNTSTYKSVAKYL